MEKFERDNIILYNCDCFELLKECEFDFDLVVTDPPYKFSQSNTKQGSNKMTKRVLENYKRLTKNENIIAGYDMRSLAEKISEKMKDINAYFFCNRLQINDYFKLYIDELNCMFDILIWKKTNAPAFFHNKYLDDKEYILYFRKGKNKLSPQTYDMASTVYTSPMEVKVKEKYYHPTIKPLGLIMKLIENTSEVGDTVFDPFSGSGTTAIACHLGGRKFIGCEINKEYFETAIKRINDEMNQIKLLQ